MILRRRLMNLEKWDLILKPKNNESFGKFPVTKLYIEANKIMICEYIGIGDRSENKCLIDGYYPRLVFSQPVISGNIFNCSNLTASSGTIIATAGRAGYIWFGQSRTGTEGWDSAMNITEMKIKIVDSI